MKQIMEATYEKTVTETLKTGEKYTCDRCGSVILDTTQIDDKFINDQDDTSVYDIACKIDGDYINKHA